MGEKKRKEKERKMGWAVALGFGLGQQIEVGNGPSWAGMGPVLKGMVLGRRKWA